MKPISTKSSILMFSLFVVCILLIGGYLFLPSIPHSLAQDDPTDRPFPTSVPVTPTIAILASPTAAEASPTAGPSQTPTLSIENIQGTSVAAQTQLEQLRTDNKALQEKLTAAEGDKGATLYALTIVVVGLLLSLGVFFGLKRSGN